MIAFRINDEYLDLNPSTSVGVEWFNPLFQQGEQTPGLLTYPITAPYTRKNQRILGSPENLSLAVPPPLEYPCQFYVEGLLWKVGVMKYRGFNGQYTLNFQSDAGDFAALIRDVRLRQIPFLPAQLTPTVASLTDTHALVPVRNELFYGENEVPSWWQGFVTDYQEGRFFAPLIPMPFLLPVLKRVFERYGYRLEGPWLGEDYVRRLIVYNNREAAPGLVDYAKHLPDVTVSFFLNSLRNMFALGFGFDATAKTVRVMRLADVAADTAYVDWTRKAEQGYSDDVVDTNGYTLRQTVESDDDLNKLLPLDWAEFKVGTGRDEIVTGISTLHQVRNPATRFGFLPRLTPAMEQKGFALNVETGENDKFSPRLLLYGGMQPDANGVSYPCASATGENFAGAAYTDRSLHYAGPRGLYENNWRRWLDFAAQARPVTRTVRLGIGDLLGLRPERKVMIDNVKYFYEKISLSLSLKDGIGKARIELKKTPL